MTNNDYAVAACIDEACTAIGALTVQLEQLPPSNHQRLPITDEIAILQNRIAMLEDLCESSLAFTAPPGHSHTTTLPA